LLVSVLWVVPLLVFAVGALLILVALRDSAVAAAALRDECARLEEVRVALASLRTDADLTRQKALSLRTAVRPSGPDR
jgi:hypothetical protein